MFPFLIGTVRTLLEVNVCQQKPSVSIPHRYGKNPVAYNTWMNYRMFPFLIGTVRTQKMQRGLTSLKVVSIPHRYGKNPFEDLTDVIGNIKFPFLIGTVRTAKGRALCPIGPKFPFLIGTVRT